MTGDEFDAIPEAPLFTYTESVRPDGVRVRTPRMGGRAIFEGDIIERVTDDYGRGWTVFLDTDGVIRKQQRPFI